jgi:peptidylprolyl isomerase
MAHAKNGDTVRVHYTGRLEDGEVFDSSHGRQPLEFTIGSGQVIAGFDQAVSGMETGAERTVTIPAEQAYGERRPELVLHVDREHFPDHLEPNVGQQLEMSRGDDSFVVTVAEVGEGQVTLDANHPLAGKDLIFDLELVEIV